METIEFISNYIKYLDEIREVIKLNLIPIVVELSEIDPHDLVTPESYFISESHARGFVWSLFLQKVKNYTDTTHWFKMHISKYEHTYRR